MLKQAEVLVVGAGPVGLFCAYELARHGIPCRIIDKKAHLSEQSKALALHIRTLDCFKQCGLLDDVVEQGQKIVGFDIKTKKGRIGTITLDGVEANRDFLINLPQSQTESILYQHLKHKGIDVEWDTELVGLSQDDDGVCAKINLKNGEVETTTYPWLIACDGAHSIVRHSLQLTFEGSEYHQNWWLADCHVHWDEPQDQLQMFPEINGPLACFPMGNSRYRLVLTAPKGIDKTPDFKDIQKVFAQRCASKANLTDPVWVSKFYIHHRQVEQYRIKRVFLAGDAAHIHSPMGRQGLNTGIQDIYNLVWKLALVYKNQAHTKLLDSYHAERFPVGQKVLKDTDRMTRMVLLQSRFMIHLRNLMMKATLSLKRLRQQMAFSLSELDISYEKSPVVEDLGHNQKLKAGCFIKDFQLSSQNDQTSARLSDILTGTKHHLFLFEGLSGHSEDSLYDLASNLNKKFSQVVTVHLVLRHAIQLPENELHIWQDKDNMQETYRIEKPMAVLFRPDQYIGFTQAPIVPKELERYLESMFV